MESLNTYRTWGVNVKGVISLELVSLPDSSHRRVYSSSAWTPMCSRDLPPGSCHVTPRRVTYCRLRAHPVHNSYRYRAIVVALVRCLGIVYVQ